jgi:hypothetical protein
MDKTQQVLEGGHGSGYPDAKALPHASSMDIDPYAITATGQAPCILNTRNIFMTETNKGNHEQPS